jgi:hypothetical protein
LTPHTHRRHPDDDVGAEAQLKKTEAAIERYMHAFEAGTITEDMFGTRVRDLGHKPAPCKLDRPN